MPKPKFPMHDYHMYKSFRIIGQAVLASAIGSSAFYVLHNLRRKSIYADFYTTYDPMVSFNRMKAGGYLQSCPPDK